MTCVTRLVLLEVVALDHQAGAAGLKHAVADVYVARAVRHAVHRLVEACLVAQQLDVVLAARGW